MKLYIFNPDTDLALANNTENYIATARVREMERELEILPMWYATKGSSILVSSLPDESFVERARSLFGIETDFILKGSTALPDDTEILPWGWNPTLRKRLLNSGIPETLLPTPIEMQEYRTLAGRANDAKILHQLRTQGKFTAEVLDNLDECRRYATAHPRCIFKSPWSGSGKGLLWCYGRYDEKSDGWCNRVIREQGYVIATPIYDKQQDFAMEYFSDGDGEITFIGYSLFDTNTKGAYNGNLLQTDAMHRSILSQYIPLNELDDTDHHLRQLLAHTYKNYKGYIGVDMMVCRNDDSTFSLHPCVEVNMRMNMGVLCSIITKRFIAEERQGRFAIEYYPTSDALQNDYRRMTDEHPLQVKDGRVHSGFLPLTPVTATNSYMAYILVK